MNNETPKDGDLRVWWVPQVPMQAFRAPVASLVEACRVLATLAAYDTFQFENRIKPDYSNAGGLEVYQLDEDGQGGWYGWEDFNTGDGIDTITETEAALLDADRILLQQVERNQR